MTWLEFKNAVKVFCTVNSVRLNTQVLLEQLIRQSVIDLQSYCEQMRFPHETRYAVTDLSEEGFASYGTLPEEATLRDAFIVKDDVPEDEEINTCARAPITSYPWSARHDLVCASPRITNCNHLMAISPQATTFLVFPKVETGYHISLFWEGIRLNFDDLTVVPFGERAVMAAAMWVQSGLAREVDHDLQLAAAYMGNPRIPGTYLYLRSLVYLDERDRRRFADSEGSPSPDNCGNTLLCATVPA